MIYVLIFGVLYPVMAMITWTAGAFGIAATLPELRDQCRERAEEEWDSALHQSEYAIEYLRTALFWRWTVAIFAGLLWPAAIPLWFGYRKGTFIAESLIRRDQLAETITAVPGRKLHPDRLY